MLPEFRIVDDNYIQGSNHLKSSSTQGTNPFKMDDDEPVDWFSIYNKRLFNFRSHSKLYQRIKHEVNTKRSLTPKVGDYDPLGINNDSKREMLQRQSAWCVMLDITHTSEEFQNFESMYFDVIRNFNPSSP
jgi:hypothetical protein